MIESIFKRKSIRTYENTPLVEHDRTYINTLLDEMKDIKGPFGNTVKWFTFDVEQFEEDKSVKLGTYGTVKNGRYFLGGIVQNTFEGMIDYGYLFEKIILQLTRKNLGTVWIGGMFNRKALDGMLLNGEVVPAISPVGYTSEYKTLRDRLTRFAVKGNQRKSFSTMFFYENINHPINEKDDTIHPWFKYLELVQACPSASNKQPWKIILSENQADFYLERTPNYAKDLEFDMQALDLGIALSHFCIGLDSDNVRYDITKTKTSIPLDSYLFVGGIRQI